jgi:acyl-CoA reductase-like NAD-dependent aldehyde dehydrogenase
MNKRIKSINPANEEVLAEYPDWEMDEINPLIEQSDQAFLQWQVMSFSEKAPYFLQMAHDENLYHGRSIG